MVPQNLIKTRRFDGNSADLPQDTDHPPGRNPLMPQPPYAVTFGETMGLLSTPSPASLAHISALSLGVGGAESNVAIGLQRMEAGRYGSSRRTGLPGRTGHP